MGYACKGFELEDAADAFNHFQGNLEVVEEYGDSCDGHALHTWDEGWRALYRCRTCGGYVLRQHSEFHGGSDDSYHNSYFPVSGPEEAHELNRNLDGWKLENEFGRRFIVHDDEKDPCYSS